MSERWKYQIKTGGGWGVFMALAMDLVDLTGMPFQDVFFSKVSIVRFTYFLLAGIFIIGYIKWKKKATSEKIAV
ncbi:hypothetical protein H4V97_002069 [Flavobacterium sp. CG_23.5]|uniref:hypothetical protein n=1 Tax=Flavobacterium sp. CG_23.5 TaxID=2760708 RepID=UPI001AE82FED|nr:hypothetical protein [Flavobacterium sp. CG_23.5]MBP2283751.1 hypothetical protein [Flavobacterium sp. CG_23.5]